MPTGPLLSVVAAGMMTVLNGGDLSERGLIVTFYEDEGFIDSYGYNSRYRWCRPNERNLTKETAPYAYSDHYLWGEPEVGSDTIYSDRLAQWDREAWKRACEEVPKQFDQFSNDDADRFMSAYYGRQIKVSALAEGCNVSTGYPYWIISCQDVEPTSTPKP